MPPEKKFSSDSAVVGNRPTSGRGAEGPAAKAYKGASIGCRIAWSRRSNSDARWNAGCDDVVQRHSLKTFGLCRSFALLQLGLPTSAMSTSEGMVPIETADGSVAAQRGA